MREWSRDWLFEFHAGIPNSCICLPSGKSCGHQGAALGYGSLHEPFAPPAHVDLCPVVELKVNLVHALLNKEDPPAMVGQ